LDANGPFLDTAAIMKNIDLVIAPNTSIAHLSGALHVPTWVILSGVATDWRWIENRDDTPWYPTMRLFRQGIQRDWDDVFNRVYGEVAATLSMD
jgi:ADP-heptose:LPS heptosyltransferase